MKKLSVFSFLLCILTAACFLVFAFQQYFSYRIPLADSYDRRFTFVSPIANEGYWGSAAHGMQKGDSLAHTNTKFIGLTQYVEQDMASAIISSIHSDVDGIITVGSRPEQIIDALKTACESQIPVVLIDTDSSEIDRICYIGTDNYRAGQLAGEDMTSDVSESLHAAVILSSLSSDNQSERLRGFEDELARHPRCSVETVLEAQSSLLLLNEMLPRTLKENPTINAIFCAEGYSSSIVGKILDSMGSDYNDIKVVAFDKMEDTLHYVESGRYFSTIVQQSDKMGELAVKVLNDYCNGILPESDIIYTDSFSIRKDNFDTVQKYESEGVTWHIYNGNILQTPQKEN